MKKRIASAISSDLPTLPTGVFPAYSSKTVDLSSSERKSHQGVSITPGETPLTLSGRSSEARVGTSAATAAFAAPITPMRMPLIERSWHRRVATSRSMR